MSVLTSVSSLKLMGDGWAHHGDMTVMSNMRYQDSRICVEAYTNVRLKQHFVRHKTTCTKPYIVNILFINCNPVRLRDVYIIIYDVNY